MLHFSNELVTGPPRKQTNKHMCPSPIRQCYSVYMSAIGKRCSVSMSVIGKRCSVSESPIWKCCSVSMSIIWKRFLLSMSTIWKRCSTFKELQHKNFPFFSFFLYLEAMNQYFDYHSGFRKHFTTTYEKFAAWFRIPLNGSQNRM